MIEASLLNERDLPKLSRLWSQTLTARGKGCTLTPDALRERILLHGGEPRVILAIDPRGWIVARSDGRLVGFIHCTVGRWPTDDPECLRGILRTMILAPDAPAAAGRVLLRAADAYFRSKRDLTNIVAFHPHSGYPLINQGRGAVFQEQWGVMEALGANGYHLTNRWLFFERHFPALIPERPPGMPGLILHMEADAMSEWRFVVRLDAEPVARARFMILPSLPDCPQSRSATLYQLEVEPERQRQGIGRWLLERSINHLIAQGVDRLLVDAPHEDVLLHARLYRLQFREQALRGYTYAKKHV